ncbi:MULTISPECIES: hypothetical protein [Bradyrhizobium]|nr:hypothetical protein [Bradyrhizobium zhengyangense]MCG2644964.1 hypothetical protein [Bradyrhizobium zhengyangense]
MPFLYQPNIHEFGGCGSTKHFTRVKSEKKTAKAATSPQQTPEAATPSWVKAFGKARDNIYKAQPAWREVTQFSIEVPIEKFDLYKQELEEKPDREEAKKPRKFPIENPRFRAIVSLFPGTGVGTIAFWLKIGSIHACDALQAVDLFKLTDPAAAFGCLKVAHRSTPFEQVSDLAKFYLQMFREESPALFTEPPERPAVHPELRRWNETYRQVLERARAYWARFQEKYPDLSRDFKEPSQEGDEQDPSFSYPFLYVSSVADTRNAADLKEGKTGQEIVSINNRYRLLDQTIAASEVEQAFEANLLQYDYGVILVSRASTVEIHAEMPFSRPKAGQTVQDSILDDLFQLMLLAEVPVMQLFSLQHVNLRLGSDLENVRTELHPRTWRNPLAVALISLVALFVAVVIIYASVRASWPLTLLRWPARLLEVCASILFWLSISVVAFSLAEPLWQNLLQKRKFMNLISRFGTVWVAGEVIYGRFNDAYQSAFPIAQLTKSYEQKQATLDSLLESGFRLFVTVVGLLVGLFTALVR